MSINAKNITKLLINISSFLKRYRLEFFLVLLVIIFGYLIIQIGKYSTQEPTDQAVKDKLTKVQRPKIDEEALAKIQQLQDQNIQVKEIFKDARNNPFSE